MTTKHDDYWGPRPGSWEEAVDPYEVQLSRFMPDKPRKDKGKRQLKIHIEQQPDYRLPASV